MYQQCKQNFNPRSPCGERPSSSVLPSSSSFYFNPRSPCGERRLLTRSVAALQIFQSTLPVRGATLNGSDYVTKKKFQSTLPVRGATDGLTVRDWEFAISIHAPRAGSDFAFIFHPPFRTNFNPRSPCGERRDCNRRIKHELYFNPRSPCGERQRKVKQQRRVILFQSTLPVRGATENQPCVVIQRFRISIHAPRAGSDSAESGFPCSLKRFQSTLPVRGATAKMHKNSLLLCKKYT